MRRTALIVVVLGALLAPAPAARADVPVVVVEGRGFGHGVGMAQDGAKWMGADGATTEQILGHFYPGTAIGSGRGDIRVVVLVEGDQEAVVTFPSGGEVRSPVSGQQHPGFPVAVPAGAGARLRFDGERYWVEVLDVTAQSAGQVGPTQVTIPPGPGGSTTTTSTTSTTSTTAPSLLPGSSTTTSTTSTTAPPPSTPLAPTSTTTTAPPTSTSTSTTTTAAPPSASGPSSPQPLWAVPAGGSTTGVPARQARYRGVVEATAAAGPLRLINQLDVEDYLRGMGEVRDRRWPVASLGAQAVAARTYALRAMSFSGEICDSVRCQVYLGQQAEFPEMDMAVAATRGWVLGYGQRLASTVYSANGGGVSATTEEGFGTSGAAHPYLRAAPYTTRDPVPWEVRVALADLGPRLGYAGTLTGVHVSRTGPSGRPTAVELQGDEGTREIPALTFDAQLGLRSTLWSVRTEVSDAPPPPPPPPEPGALTVQALPEQVEEVVEQQAADARPRPSAKPSSAARRPRSELPPDRPDVAPWLVGGLAAAVLAAGAYGAWTVTRAERRGTLVLGHPPRVSQDQSSLTPGPDGG